MRWRVVGVVGRGTAAAAHCRDHRYFGGGEGVPAVIHLIIIIGGI
jgi:hypothetical protein